MANDIFTDKQKAEFRKLTQNIDYISGRESYSVEFYREITNRMDIPHVLDPVFLLPEAKYIEIAETSRMKIDTPYLLIYLPVDDNETLVEQAATYAEKHGLTLIELSHRNYKRNHKVIFDIGPEDFLYLLYNSNVVFTNSFHAICFSILFQKEFYAFSRANAGKVEDMCKQFGLEERYFSDNVLIERKDIDYSLINESVNTKIEASKQWLIDAIES